MDYKVLPRQTKASCFPFAQASSAAQAAIKLFSLRPCSPSIVLFSQQPGRQRLHHGDLCLRGPKARLIQGIPQTTCRLELPGRRSLTAQGPSPGEAGQPCAQQLHLQEPVGAKEWEQFLAERQRAAWGCKAANAVSRVSCSQKGHMGKGRGRRGEKAEITTLLQTLWVPSPASFAPSRCQQQPGRLQCTPGEGCPSRNAGCNAGRILIVKH
ncbi:uncharacterized protein LOC130257789 [Oenanthe melanoleuca]|uniref:uncharacterized protein LOC130257789 n=1 Tax=Oenanthe melanoleuca TaxID=2939378 RepID=UPI0024C1FE23|nr:uncharacterized protein LOC130257789 [Oenanthe melanoleuca]